MDDTMKPSEEYISEIEDLRARLEEAEETLRAIQSGEVDALVVAGPEGHPVYTLKGEERTYRILVESMNEGAVILSPEGTVIYANQSYALMLGTRLERIIGSDIRELVSNADWKTIDELIQCGKDCLHTAEIGIRTHRHDELMPARVSLSALQLDDFSGIFMVVTDLTESKRQENELRVYQERLEELVQERTGALQMVNEELETTNEELAATNEELEATNQEMQITTDELQHEIAERKQAEDQIIRQNAIVEGIDRIFYAVLASKTESELGLTCLKVAEELTRSNFGIIGEVDLSGKFYDIAVSDPGWEACRVIDPATGSIWTPKNMEIHGVYGRVILGGQGFFTNDPPSHPDSIGVPQGHPPLTSFLGVPLSLGGKAIGMIGLGNREGGYRQEDLDAIESLAPAIVEALLRRRAEELVRENEERFRQLAEAAFEGLVIHDNGLMVDANRRLTDMLGYDRSYLVGKPFWEFIDRKYHDLVRQHVTSASSEAYELELIHKDGRRVPVEVVGRSITWQGRQVRAAALRDITERKQAEITLRNTLRRFYIMLSGMYTGVLLMTEDGRVEFANQAFSGFYGLKTPDEIIGMTSTELLDKIKPAFQDPDAAAARIGDILERGEPVRGEEFTVNNGRTAMRDFVPLHVEGASTGRLWLHVDISERKQAEQELLETKERLDWILHTITEGYYVLDSEWRFVDANPVAEKHFGRSVEELRDVDVWSLSPKKEGDLVYDKFHLAIAVGIPVHFEAESDVRPGTWWELHLYPRGGLLEVYFRDITARKQAEQDLAIARAEAERRSAELHSFVYSMSEGIVLFDNEPKALLVNDAVKELLNPPPDVPYDEWITAYELRTLDGQPVSIEDYPSRRALRGEVTEDARFRMVSPWRESLVSITGSPVRDVDDNIVGGSLSFRDASVRIEFEQQQKELLDRESRISEALQRALIPDTEYDLPCCEIAVKYEAALDEAKVGGDFYDVFELGDNKVAILVGDVAGKGLAAAIQVAAARHSFRSYAYIDPRPERVMTLANNALCKDPKIGITMLTAFFAIVDLDLGVMTYANGGHETPVLRRADGTVAELAVQGRALGVLQDYNYEDRGIILGPGDLVAIVTDGVTEARVTSDDMFGLEGIKMFLSKAELRSSDAVADGLLAAAKEHGGGSLKDDAAVLVFGLKETPKK
jgi:PAS domain S-box-containing protein